MSRSGHVSGASSRSARPIELHQWRLFVAYPAGHRPSIHALGIDAERKSVRVTSAIVSVDPEGWVCQTRTRGYRLLGQPMHDARPQLDVALKRWCDSHTPNVRPLHASGEGSRGDLLAAAASFLAAAAPKRRQPDTVLELLNSGQLVPSAAAAQRLGRREEDLARQTHRLFSLATPDGPAYPAFLFDDGLIRAGLGEVLVSLSATDPWTKWLFLTQPSAALGGTTPLAALRGGRADVRKSVVRLARAKSRRKR